VADLDMKDAEVLADSLCTINHPMLQAARLSTAMDLHDWCHGGIFEGRPWTPLEQANALVQEARLTFGDWAKAGGTTALLAIYRAKFPEPLKPALPPLTTAELIATGRVAAPCEYCDPGEPWCQFGGAKGHARYLPGGIFGPRQHEIAVEELRHRDRPATILTMPRAASILPPTYEEMQARGKAQYEDECRRKREQLQRLNGEAS
jgi:hypothetical protein